MTHVTGDQSLPVRTLGAAPPGPDREGLQTISAEGPSVEPLRGPVALVTGCSRGIGLLAAVELARAGYRVVATLRRPEARSRLDAAAATAGVELDVQQLDVTDPDTIARCAAHVAQTYGCLTVLVNNAGYALVGPMEEIGVDALRRQLETNVVGVAEVTRAFLPLMRARRDGRIINISSAAGRTTIPLMAPYHASKWALEGMTEAWRYELASFGIRVILIEPGSHQTDFHGDSMEHVEDLDGSPYGPIIRRMQAARPFILRLAGNPGTVARVIRRAATARRPRLRYVVGLDAWLAVLGRTLLPGGFLTAITARVFGLPRRL
jgi:NAD(P)-dependent dehydrogenase (short-subunit alcohol dehydrogenase family)